MSVIIRKDGLYTHEWIYNEGDEEGKWVDTIAELPLFCWYEKVEEIEEGLTLRQLLKVLEPELDIIQVLIREELDPFLREMDEVDPRASEVDPDPLTRCEIYCAPALEQWIEDEHYSFENYWGFHAWGRSDETPYSLSWSHWSRFCDLPITLPKTHKFCMTGPKGQRTYETFDVEVQPELGEMIHDIFFDLCFCGSPENRDAQSAECMRRMEEVKNGTAELIPFDLEKLE